MKDAIKVIGVICCLCCIGSIMYGSYYVVKNLSWYLWYEDLAEQKVIEMTQMEFLEPEFKPRKHDWLMKNKPGRKENIRKIYKEYRAKDK